MNYKTIKLASEAPMQCEFVKRDSSIMAVVIGDLRIEADYGIRVMIAQPYDEVSRHRVTATIEGFGKKVLHFDTRYDANAQVSQMEAAGATVEREDVKVLVDDQGRVLETMLSTPSDNSLDDCPF